MTKYLYDTYVDHTEYDMDLLTQEAFVVITLDGKMVVTACTIVSKGNRINLKEIFKNVLKFDAEYMAVVHSKPKIAKQSSYTERNNKEVLKQIGRTLGVTVIDYILADEDNYYSLAVNREF